MTLAGYQLSVLPEVQPYFLRNPHSSPEPPTFHFGDYLRWGQHIGTVLKTHTRNDGHQDLHIQWNRNPQNTHWYTPEQCTPFSPLSPIEACLLAALGNWPALQQQLRRGLTDDELQQAISTCFDPFKGSNHPYNGWHCESHDGNPQLWLHCLKTGEPDLQGQPLLHQVRSLLGVPHQPKRRHSPKGHASGWIEERIGNKKRKTPNTSYYYCYQDCDRRHKLYVPVGKMYRIRQLIDQRQPVAAIILFLNTPL